MNQSYLPDTWPMLNCLFALDGGPDVVVLLVIDKHLQSVSPGKALNRPFAMLIHTSWKVTWYAHIQRTIASIGHDVDPATHASPSLHCHAGGAVELAQTA